MGSTPPCSANAPPSIPPRPRDPDLEDGADSRAKGAHWLPQAPPTGTRSRPTALGATAGAGPDAATPGGPRVHPSARSPPGPAAAPAAARCSASPSPCGAARLGPAPTPRSPRRPPGPPSSAHVTAAGSPQTTLSATARTHSHAVSGAGTTRFRARPPTPPPAPWLCLAIRQPDGVPTARTKGTSLEGAQFCQGHCLFIRRHVFLGTSTLWGLPARKLCCLGPAWGPQLPVCHQVLGMRTPELAFVPTPLSTDPASLLKCSCDHHRHMATTF